MSMKARRGQNATAWRGRSRLVVVTAAPSILTALTLFGLATLLTYGVTRDSDRVATAFAGFAFHEATRHAVAELAAETAHLSSSRELAAAADGYDAEATLAILKAAIAAPAAHVQRKVELGVPKLGETAQRAAVAAVSPPLILL